VPLGYLFSNRRRRGDDQPLRRRQASVLWEAYPALGKDSLLLLLCGRICVATGEKLFGTERSFSARLGYEQRSTRDSTAHSPPHLNERAGSYKIVRQALRRQVFTQSNSKVVPVDTSLATSVFGFWKRRCVNDSRYVDPTSQGRARAA
jgi:hypothetical protein